MKRIYLSCLSAGFMLLSYSSIAQCWCSFLTGLTASQQTNKQVKISWNTDTESSTAKDFIVQRSYSGFASDITNIGYVSANPNALSHVYNFYDAYPCNGSATTVYYRLKSVNIDNNERFSSIVTASLNGCPTGCSSPSSPTICQCNMNTLTGPSIICSGTGVYEVTNAAGAVSWSVSNGSIASITATSSSRATLTKNGDGQITVTATISNCATLNKTVVLGTPAPSTIIMESQACIGYTDWEASFIVSPVISGTTYLWSVNGSSFFTGSATYSFAQSMDPYITFDLKYQNSCGTSSQLSFPITFYSSCPGFRAIVSPNPAKNNLMVTIEEKKGYKSSPTNGGLEVRIYDFNNSTLLSTQRTIRGIKELRLNTRMLKPGKYLLHIKYGNETIVQQ
ncbi:MAG: T9SS type A sorting domain-containing protein, partial [Chitinophagaceae bacterium]